MKKLIIYLSLSSAIFFLHGQVNQPSSISEKQVPKAVLKTFKKKRPNASGATWYPYPNQYGKDRGTVPRYFPIGWRGYVQDYYEVKFFDEIGPLREVYDRGGNWKVTSRPVDGFPEQLNAILNEKGYSEWNREKLEKISKVGQSGKFYKVKVSQDKKKRVLYFDESFKLVRSWRWDNDTKLMVNVNAKLKEAPIRRNKRVITADNVPAEVRSKAKKNHINVEIIEWSVYSRPFDDPEGSAEFSFYDIPVPAYYQLIFSDKTDRFVVSYSVEGELLEIADLIETKKLPKAVRQTISSEAYESWKWESEHERVEAEDGNIYFRLYGSENDTPRVLIMSADGKTVNLKRT